MQVSQNTNIITTNNVHILKTYLIYHYLSRIIFLNLEIIEKPLRARSCVKFDLPIDCQLTEWASAGGAGVALVGEEPAGEPIKALITPWLFATQTSGCIISNYISTFYIFVFRGVVKKISSCSAPISEKNQYRTYEIKILSCSGSN